MWTHRFRSHATVAIRRRPPPPPVVARATAATAALGTCYSLMVADRDSTTSTGRRKPPFAIVVQCDAPDGLHPHPETHTGTNNTNKRSLRKRATLQRASATTSDNSSSRMHTTPATNTDAQSKPTQGVPQRRPTVVELGKLSAQEAEMLQRWERDEDGWRELPSRAWPAYQPNETEMTSILAVSDRLGCGTLPFPKDSLSSSSKNTTTDIDSDTDDNNDSKNKMMECAELLFQVATTLVFYNIDAQAGLDQYRRLAQAGHVESMVGCGVILVEGLGVVPNEQEGIKWLERAAGLGSSQAHYELGSVYYTGLDDVVEEDPERAFAHFQCAADQHHTGGLFMVADCLVEGDGTAVNVARAIPLLYQAAEQGHRYA